MIKWINKIDMSKIYLGIDPGSDGYLAVIDNGEYRFLPIEDTPMLEIGKFVGEFRDTQCVAVLEDVHSVFGSSAQGTFNFGLSKGFLLGLLIAHRIPYVLVAPKDWQSGVWINADKEYTTQKQKLKNGGEKTVRKVETKQTSYNAALRLFPDVDFRKSARCTKPHDGKVDALLMAEYGRRMNL